MGRAQWVDDEFCDEFAGAEGRLGAGDSAERVGIVGHPPVSLEALRGDPRAPRAAERQAFGKSAVVTVQQSGSVGMQCMDLQEAGGGHQDVPSFERVRAAWSRRP